MANRVSAIGLSAMRASEIGMRHSAANLQAMVGSVASRARALPTVVLSRSVSLGGVRRKNPQTTPSAAPETQDSPLSQPERTPEVEEKALERPLLPWETRDAEGEAVETARVKDKILELAVYRRTFVEPADGEEEYVFALEAHRVVVRQLLSSNPDLREKHTLLVESGLVEEERFWRNYLLRCNAIRVTEGLPSYLPEAEHTPLPTGPFARFKRGLLVRKQGLGRLRFNLLRGGRRSVSADSADPTPREVELGDLELDLDGEIEKELVKRRPSRAVEKLQTEPKQRLQTYREEEEPQPEVEPEHEHEHEQGLPDETEHQAKQGPQGEVEKAVSTASTSQE